MTKRKSRDPLALEIMRDVEKRTGHHVDVEKIKATVARFRAEEGQDKSLALVDAFLQTIEALTEAAAARLPREQRRRRAAAIQREIDADADELRRQAVDAPVTRAEEEAAKRHGIPNRAALNRWLRRNR